MTKKKTENYLEGVLNYYDENNRQQEQPEPIKEPETKTETEPEREKVPASESGSIKEIDTTEKEYKTKRVQFLLYPRIHKGLMELAEQLRAETGNEKISANDIVNQVLDNFLKGVKKQ